MIVEYVQILSTAWHVLSPDNVPAQAYKQTRTNHPSTVWVRSSREHYQWLVECTKELCKLYTTHTGKVHKTQTVLEALAEPPQTIPCKAWQDPPVAAPDQFKAVAVFSGAAIAYQAYLMAKFEDWLTKDKPLKVQFFSKAPVWVNSSLKNKIEII